MRARDRLLALGAVAALVVALVVLATRSMPSSPGAGEASPTASPSPVAVPSPTPLPGPEVFDNPGAAARLTADALLATAVRVHDQTPLAGDWPVSGERPVYVVSARVHDGRRLVVADELIAFRLQEATDRLSLRWLAASGLLGGEAPVVVASVDGRETSTELDADAALLHVDLGGRRQAGEAISLRISLNVALVDADELVGEGPVGYGLLSHDDDVSVLSHWLPLLTFDDGPLVAAGDVGAFPPAVWAAEIVHPGILVTTGVEGPCRVDVPNCTRAEGVGLRDLSMLVADRGTVLVGRAGGHEVRVVHRVADDEASAVLAETVAAIELFDELFGGLAWSQTDVVGAPLSRGAAGMEYPGMFVLRDDLWDATSGAFGTYVIAHEVAHQWFHALVGNSSLADPVVDEALAQYLAYLYYAEEISQAAADDLAGDMRGRYDEAVADGLEPAPPAQHLGDFHDDGAYGALVYGRAPLAFVAAEVELGRDAVVAFLADIVASHGLGTLSAARLLEDAQNYDERLATTLRRWWFDERPI